jgi:hypothetical protein
MSINIGCEKSGVKFWGKSLTLTPDLRILEYRIKTGFSAKYTVIQGLTIHREMSKPSAPTVF